MTGDPRSTLVRQFRALFESGTVAGLSDGQLLERFVGGSDGGEAAFAALVARHGPMVLGVCRRALADPDDAADAFQATFLVLVKKARSVRVDDSLGRWLYGVSRKVAARARALAARNPRASGVGLESIEAGPADPDRFELRAMLDEELGRLPEAFRTAIVLCDLGGMTHEEAARDLLCPVGTIKSRLSRGRKKLRERLEGRGLTASSLAIPPVVPASLVGATARASWLMSTSISQSPGLVPAASVLLAQEVLKSMMGFKLKLAAATILSLGVVATGAGVVARGQDGGGGRAVVEAKPAGAGPGAAREGDANRRRVVEVLGDRITLDGKEIDPAGLAEALKASAGADGKPAGSALIRISADQKFRDVDRVLEAVRASGIAVIDVRGVDPPVEARLDGPAKLRFQGAAGLGPAALKPTARPGRRPWPGGGPSVNPPREFSKVSLPDYVVEPPDIIVVEVLKALPGRPITGERLVKPDGKISLGFYGEVFVSGLTLVEIKEKVALHLREFLDDADLGLTRADAKAGRVVEVAPGKSDRVFVDVAAYNSKAYYVQGEVGTPGRLPITGNETVLDAINYAGGLGPKASKANVRLVRPFPPGIQGETTLFVDLDAIVQKGDAATNYQLFPGDRVIVPGVPDAPQPEGPSPLREGAIPREVEARLQALERKLDEVLKALDRKTQP